MQSYKTNVILRTGKRRGGRKSPVPRLLLEVDGRHVGDAAGDAG